MSTGQGVDLPRKPRRLPFSYGVHQRIEGGSGSLKLTSPSDVTDLEIQSTDYTPAGSSWDKVPRLWVVVFLRPSLTPSCRDLKP
eukprot:261132-Hanusia_phi.AAC.1